MSLPIIDINSGDTMSSMVDKINYNFTLLSLKGGGPQGIQGIQGIRGPIGLQGLQGLQGFAGSMIHGGQPDPSSTVGDVYIDNGVIQQVTAPGEFQVITDLNHSVNSPFGYTALQTINPHEELESFQFVLGTHTGEQAINENLPGVSLMHFTERTGYDYIHFNKDNNTNIGIARKGTSNNAEDRLEIVGDYILIGNTDNNLVNSIDFKLNGIYFNNRTRNAFNGSLFVIGTDEYGKTDVNNSNVLSYKYDSNGFSQFPVSGMSTINTIGLRGSESGYNNKIDTIYFNGDSHLNFDENFSALKFFNITSSRNNGTVVSTFSEKGIALGGLAANTIHTSFANNEFGLFIKYPDNVTAECGPRISMISKFSKNRLIFAEQLMHPSGQILSPNVSLNTTVPNWIYSSYMNCETSVTPNSIIYEKNTNLIVADKLTVTSLKNASDSLHIHGADGVSAPGCDVIISGGNSVNSNSMTSVGGDVYIAGGVCSKTFNYNGSSWVQSDQVRAGNVIIGLNPLHHKSCFGTSAYTSFNNIERTAGTNPKDVTSFDISNVAIHGNRIVIDSDANERKITNGYKNGLATYTPYVTAPQNATLQVSGVNTVRHESPIVLSQEEICSHQFMSGVMRRIIRYRLATPTSSISVSEVDPKTMYSDNVHYDSYTKNDNIGSVYFIYDQVWQKIGNTVNVHAFGKWVASKHMDTRLYNVCDRFFFDITNGANEWSAQWIDENKYSTANRTLGHLLLNNEGSNIAYADITTDINSFRRQPMTVMAMPIVVKGMKCSYAYGNGDIYTESITTNNTRSLLQASHVMLGGYHGTTNIPSGTADIDFSFYGKRINGTTPTNTGMRSFLHYSQNPRQYGGQNPHIYAWNEYPNSTAVNTQDVRFAFPGQVSPGDDYWWNEQYLSGNRSEIMNDDWSYIIPEMLVNYGNTNVSSHSNKENLVMRPCVGMYTWISMNYTYNIMSDFNYESLKLGYKTT